MSIHPFSHISRASLIIIVMTGMLGLMATDIYAPAIPAMAQLFHTSNFYIQLSISSFLCGLSLSQLISGSLSDHYGRKPVLYFGCISFLISTLILIFPQPIYLFLLMRFFQGIGAGAITVLSRILLRDFMSGTDMARYGSYLAAGIGLAPAIAPLIGGYLSVHFGIYAIFIFLFLFVSLLLYLARYHLTETNRYIISNQKIIFYQNHIRVLTNKAFWQHVIPTGTCLSAIILNATQNPLIAQRLLHVPPILYTQGASLATSGVFFGMILNAQLLRFFRIESVLRGGIIFIILLALGLMVISNLSFFSFFYLMLFTFLISISSALVLPNSGAQAFSPFGDIAGTVGALYGTIQMFITAGSTALFSYWVNSPSTKDLSLGLLCLMGICLLGYELLGIRRK